MSEWYFEKRDPRGVHSVPKNDEHFAHVRGIVASLVRETVQNSGDAAAGSTPVRMVFRFGRLNLENFEPHIVGLRDRLQGIPGLQSMQKVLAEKTVRYLVIEDFETHGLRGSFDPSSDAQDSSYIAFWHRYGESGKSQTHGGRHGLGKSTIASASKLRLFFGATVPSDTDPRKLLLQGQISLRPHLFNGDYYDAYGLWYDGDRKTGLRPFIDKAANNFVHDFNLERGRKPGLSLVVPFPVEELTPEEITKAVIENSFHQIASGQLIVRVDDVTIEPATIRKHAATYGLGTLETAIELSSEIAQQKGQYVEPRRDSVNERLKPEHFDDKTLRDLRKDWLGGRTICVRLPVSIRKKGAGAQAGEVNLYARRLHSPDQSRETYVRGRVTVPMKALADHSNCVALLVADTGIASTFLGDSEPPAHNQWHIWRLKNEYYKPEDALNRIKYALRDLIQLLETGDDEQLFKDAFAEFLWTVKADVDPDDRDKSRNRPNKPDPNIPPAPPSPHRLQRIEGGFAYRYSPPAEMAESLDGARITVSYRRRSGAKASKKKTKFGDFHTKLPVEATGKGSCEQDVAPRQICFQLTDVEPDYELRVLGFDPNRDIEIRFDTRAQ